jgi:hypothetical protein
MSGIALVFDELFYGSGAWLGILLLLVIILGISLKTKYAGLLMIPVTVFLGIDYLTEDMLWHSIIMFITSVFVVINVFRKGD